MREYSPWTHQQEETLRRSYKHQSVLEIAKCLSKTEASIRNRAYSLGLRRSKNYLRRQGHANLRLGPVKNNKDIGTITIRGRRDKWIKTESGWTPLHRHVWERSNGEIPAGYTIQFKDGDSLNCELGNLCLLSRKDVMRVKNVYKIYPNDIVQCTRMIAKLQKMARQ